MRNFAEVWKPRDNCVEFDISCKMSLQLLNVVLKQPRTSPLKLKFEYFSDCDGLVMNIVSASMVRFAMVSILEHCPRIREDLRLHSDANCYSIVQSSVPIPSQGFPKYSQHVRAKKKCHHRLLGSCCAPCRRSSTARLRDFALLTLFFLFRFSQFF